MYVFYVHILTWLSPACQLIFPLRWSSACPYNSGMVSAPIKPAITMDLLERIAIRDGTIRSVTDVPNSENLVQLRVSFGDHERTVVAGLRKERANPREVEGMTRESESAKSSPRRSGCVRRSNTSVP